GNLRALMCWLQAGRPLPFRTLRNQRSLLGLDLLSRVVERALAIGLSGTFNVADPRPISTAELGLALQSELGGDVWPFPSSLLRAAAAIAGRDAVAQRLTDSLVLDTRRIQAQCADLFTHVDTRAGLVSMAADHRISFASPTSFR
ncbi:MAG: hypothetical protein LPK85_02750, partial [Gammaproteobacteria bacterium]|nr:hypothetical protein [Gammaproteobacteria bacterium]